MVALFLCSHYEEKDFLNLRIIPDSKILAIDNVLNFTHLLPHVELFEDYMDFIDEYFDKVLKFKIENMATK